MLVLLLNDDGLQPNGLINQFLIFGDEFVHTCVLHGLLDSLIFCIELIYVLILVSNDLFQCDVLLILEDDALVVSVGWMFFDDEEVSH